MSEKPVFFVGSGSNPVGIALGIVIPAVVLAGVAVALVMLKKKGILFAAKPVGEVNSTNDGATEADGSSAATEAEETVEADDNTVETDEENNGK